MKKQATVALSGLILLVACGAPQPLAEHDREVYRRLACARLAEPEVPGGHGAYGGYYQDDHPYYLGEKYPRESREGRTFVDPYFRPGQEEVSFRAYRSCLRGDRW